jgi:predicted AAA+ superfamily ATPase
LAPPEERPLASELYKGLLRRSPRRFYVVVGPRRVGKSTCLYQTVRHLLAAGVARTKIYWLRLDHPLLMEISLGKLVEAVVQASQATMEAPAYVFLDEITYAKDWDRWLKTFYDDRWPVQIAASSSATALLRRQHHESGVGRWDELYLPPYSFSEYLELMGERVSITPGLTLAETLAAVAAEPPERPDLYARLRRFLLTGGFPELLLASEELPATDETDIILQAQGRLRDAAVIRAIYQDIPQAFGIDNPLLLERLLYALGGQVTGVLSPSKIAGALGMSTPTFDKYLAYLEQAFLIFTTANYSQNELNVQKRGRKLYFVDGAVRNAALQRGPLPLHSPEEYGLLLENVAASHLYALAQLRQVRLYHWRQDAVAEVDLVLGEPSSPLAVEVGRGGDHPRRGLVALMKRHPNLEQGCYYTSPGILAQPTSRGEGGIGSLPIDLFLLAVGAQSRAALRVRIGT